MSQVPPPTGGSGGTEKRGQILPNQAPEDTSLPNYDFAGNVPTPASVGVRRDGSFGGVINAAKGIIYYTDVMGFGEATSSLTRDMPYSRLGINFFMKSGLQCTNGADMWQYFQGIPDGSALGTRVRDAIAEMGMPQMRGLAPGILEDVKAAMNPNPLLRSAFGSVYPVCELKTLNVGDDQGRIKDPKTNDVWVKGEVQYKDGRPVQTRWVQKVDKRGDPIFVDKGEADKTPKTQKPDGSPVDPPPRVEYFEDGQKASLLMAIVLGLLAYAVNRK
jgi:hypothetical protein